MDKPVHSRKGRPNRGTINLQGLLKKYKLEPIKGIHKCLKRLEKIKAYEACDQIEALKVEGALYVDLLSYIYPKRKSIDINHQVTEQQHIIWDFRYGDGDENCIIAETNPASVENPQLEKKV